METYILKSAACLAIFFLFYKVFLENASFHKFKRGYLLGSLTASFLIPFITFTTYVENVASTTAFTPVFTGSVSTVPVETIAETPFNYLHLIWIIYGIGVLFFAIRFLKNLLTISSNIKNNTKEKHGYFMHVLLKDFMAPHTFFNNLFFYKGAYEAGEIPDEVIWHEETHAQQKHSLDIMFIELLKIAFWFNPFIYLFKNSMKLNHEFLADSAVIERQQDTTNYQKILLHYARTATSPSMANAINYSSIKKRFTIMKTHTSKRAGLLKGILILPLLAVLLYGFSSTQKVIKVDSNPKITSNSLELSNDKVSPNEQNHLTARSISIKILNDNFLEVEGLKIPKKDLASHLESLNIDVTKKQKERIINVHVSSLNDITYGDLQFIQRVASAYGYHRIVTPKEELIRSKGNVPMTPKSTANTQEDYVKQYMEGATPAQLKIYNELASKYNVQPIETRKIPTSDLKILELIYNKMTKNQKENAHPFPECLPKEVASNTQEDYSKEYMDGAERNDKKAFVLQIELSSIRFNGIPVKLNQLVKTVDEYTKDWEEKDYINAHPSVLIASTPREYLDRINKEFKKTHYSKANGGINIIPPPPPLPPTPSSIGNSDNASTPPSPPLAPRVRRGEDSNIPPPPPLDVLDHIIKKAKENASFSYNGKSITSDKAISLIKNNSSLNVHSKKLKNNKAVVEITDEPITIEN